MAAENTCRYCGARTEDVKWAPLKCKVCAQFVHLNCIRSERPPACYGDRFFDFTCRFCSGTGSELCARLHMTWLQAVHLSVYHVLMDGQGRKGYLHYSDNIGSFISSNWKRIVPYRKKTTAWISTIAGVLSSNCPAIFRSGTEVLKDPGWWTLAEMKPPDPNQPSTKGGSKRQTSQASKQKSSIPQSKARRAAPKESVPPQKSSTQLVSKHRISLPVKSAKHSVDSVQPSQPPNNIRQTGPPQTKRPKIESLHEDADTNHELKQEADSLIQKLKEQDDSLSLRLKPLTERQEKLAIRHLSKMEDILIANTQARQMLAKLKLRQRYRQCKVPLFDLDAIVQKMLRTTKSYKIDRHNDSMLIPVKYSQEEMQQNSKDFQNREDTSAYSPISTFMRDFPFDALNNSLVLSSVLPPVQSDFHSKTIGNRFKVETFVSPYTKRVLKPIIWQDREVESRRVKLLADIQQHYTSTHLDHTEMSTGGSHGGIVYCYLREHHVTAVNALIANFFWSGVNIGECLEYPDFTVVAMHKKLVVGCGFLTPDVRVNEAYISFLLVHPDWQGCGIGSFMLYHLTQTCMGKDIVLHVSVENHPALLLYQKFGFKMEKLCLGFYERYYPANFHLSKHACFMRLRR